MTDAGEEAHLVPTLKAEKERLQEVRVRIKAYKESADFKQRRAMQKAQLAAEVRAKLLEEDREVREVLEQELHDEYAKRQAEVRQAYLAERQALEQKHQHRMRKKRAADRELMHARKQRSDTEHRAPSAHVQDLSLGSLRRPLPPLPPAAKPHTQEPESDSEEDMPVGALRHRAAGPPSAQGEESGSEEDMRVGALRHRVAPSPSAQGEESGSEEDMTVGALRRRAIQEEEEADLYDETYWTPAALREEEEERQFMRELHFQLARHEDGRGRRPADGPSPEVVAVQAMSLFRDGV